MTRKLTVKDRYYKWVDRRWHSVRNLGWARCMELAFQAGYQAAIRAQRKEASRGK